MATFFALACFFSIPALLAVLIAPKMFRRVLGEDVTRAKGAKIFGALLVTSFVGVGMTAPPPAAQEELLADEGNSEEIVTTENELATDDASKTGTEEESAAAAGDVATVVRVVDGDTVALVINGEEETVRIIGINTPETVDPRKPVECFGKEASQKAHELLDGQTVHVVADASQGDRDKYDRLLRFITLPSGDDFGETMIAQGYAYEYTYKTAYEKQSDYQAAQTEAQNAKRGLWADDACGEATSTSQDTSSSTTATTPAVTVPADSSPTPVSTTTTSCTCSANTLNCGDFATHAAAQAYYECCMVQVGSDVHGLDGSDNDGQACESRP